MLIMCVLKTKPTDHAARYLTEFCQIVAQQNGLSKAGPIMSYWEGVTSRIKDNHTQLNVNVSTLKALISQVLVIKHHTPTAMS